MTWWSSFRSYCYQHDAPLFWPGQLDTWLRAAANLEYFDTRVKYIIAQLVFESLFEQSQMTLKEQNRCCIDAYAKYTDSWFDDKTLLDDLVYIMANT